MFPIYKVTDLTMHYSFYRYITSHLHNAGGLAPIVLLCQITIINGEVLPTQAYHSVGSPSVR